MNIGFNLPFFQNDIETYHFHLQISGKWLDFKELLIKIDYPFQ